MVSLVIPVYNGGEVYKKCLNSINNQTVRFSRKIVMESGSTDDSKALSFAHGFEVYEVTPGTFNHGKTRTDAAQKIQDEIIVFLTQDAILGEVSSIERLVEAFEDPEIGAAFGRQLPHDDANPIATHMRLSSYKDRSHVTSMSSDYPVGIRKCNLSNSFAAYRRSALEEVGWFPSDVILGEDMYAAARMLTSGWKVSYVSEATVKHSHNYRITEEFRRYFDIGVFHKQERWILEEFGSPESEGVRVTLDQMKFLLFRGDWLFIPKSIGIAAAKFLGYKLGRKHDRLGVDISKRLAMHPGFFKETD